MLHVTTLVRGSACSDQPAQIFQGPLNLGLQVDDTCLWVGSGRAVGLISLPRDSHEIMVLLGFDFDTLLVGVQVKVINYIYCHMVLHVIEPTLDFHLRTGRR